MTTDAGWRWLESTRRLQAEAFGFDFAGMSDAERADYLTWNAYAAVEEITEAMRELQWKPWAKNRGTLNRAAFVEELVDAAHFLANMACAVGCTDAEWEERYRRKQYINRGRQADGYTARNGT